MPKRALLIFALLGLLGVAWLGGRLMLRDVSLRPQSDKAAAVTIIKQPAIIAQRTFDPAAPPPDMPPLGPGEVAVCDSNFISSANVAGNSRQEDSTHATVTVAHVTVTLQLNITIWVPPEVTQHVIEHEEGHRQISEYFYQSADKIADQIAETYIGKQVQISGTDLNSESNKALQQMAADITDQYDKQLNPNPTQLLYDSITDHSRNEIVARDAVVAAINDAAISAIQPPTSPGN